MTRLSQRAEQIRRASCHSGLAKQLNRPEIAAMFDRNINDELARIDRARAEASRQTAIDMLDGPMAGIASSCGAFKRITKNIPINEGTAILTRAHARTLRDLADLLDDVARRCDRPARPVLMQAAE